MGDFNRDFDRNRSGRSRGRGSGGFDRGRSGRSDRRSGGFGGRDRGRDRDRRSERLEMHSGVCDKCGKDCEVPFKPTQGKPLYCNDCFKDQGRESGSRGGFGKQSNENLDQINKKLDRILNILGGKKEPVEEKPVLKKSKKKEKAKKIEEEPEKIEEEKPEKKEKAKKKES